MFIKHFLLLLFIFCATNVFSENTAQLSLKKDSFSYFPEYKQQKYSLFAKPVYQQSKSNYFKYESANHKHGLYIKNIISGRADSFLNTQGIIMNMGTNANDINKKNNVTRTWIFFASSIIEAKLDDSIRIYFHPDFGQEQYRIFDANVDLNYLRTFSLMTGLQTSPIAGLEPYVFNYFGFTSIMSPFKEVALKLHGEIGPSLESYYSYLNNRGINSWFYYELAFTNGAPDGAFPGLIPFSATSSNNLYQSNTFNTGNKAFEGRLFLNPFITQDHHPLQHFGIGFSGSAMSVINQIGLPAYRSIGQNVIFQFNNGSDSFSIAQGRRNRIHPQFTWYHKNFALIGDYIISSQQLSTRFNSSIREYPTIQQINHAKQAMIIWNMTGENYTWIPNFEPNNNFKPFDIVNTGAFQLGFRYSALSLDSSVFSDFSTTPQGRTIYKYSDPRTSVQQANAFGVVLNWLWNSTFRLSTEFSYTKFKGGCSSGALASPINPGCLTAPNEYINQPGSVVLDRPPEVVLFQQASIMF